MEGDCEAFDKAEYLKVQEQWVFQPVRVVNVVGEIDGWLEVGF